jgi:transcription elongation factor GreA
MNDIKKRLEDEIRTLDYELKVQLPKEIQTAREYGDLRENAEYKAAKERQSYLQARLGQLHRRVAALSLINLDRIPRDKVGLGSTVNVHDTGSGEDTVYEIVTPEEADPTWGGSRPRHRSASASSATRRATWSRSACPRARASWRSPSS